MSINNEAIKYYKKKVIYFQRKMTETHVNCEFIGNTIIKLFHHPSKSSFDISKVNE